MATDRSKKQKALADTSSKFVMLAHKYNPEKHVTEVVRTKQVDITGWLIQEKIDGVRAIYSNGKLWTRNKKKIYAPKEFLDLCNTSSNLKLDGELVHPDGFQTTVSIVKDQSEKANWDYWKSIKFVVFDQKTNKATKYIERLAEILIELDTSKNVYVLPIRSKVRSQEHLMDELNKVELLSGEGLIIKNPNSRYKLGRSHDILKVKSFTDVEALVVEHIEGEGKHKGRLGKVVCRLDNGIEFECGTGFTDQERENPPKIGAMITVKYFELTEAGKPRFPIFITERDYE